MTLLEQHRTAQNRITSPSSIFVYIGVCCVVRVWEVLLMLADAG